MSLRELVVGHLEWLGRLSRRLCCRREDAEDLLQESVCRMLSAEHLYREDMAFKPWAKTVVLNTYIGAYNHRRAVLMTALTDEHTAICDSATDHRIEMAEIVDVLERLSVRSLSVKALTLFVAGYSYADVATLTGAGVETVRARIATGRRMVKKALGYKRQ